MRRGANLWPMLAVACALSGCGTRTAPPVGSVPPAAFETTPSPTAAPVAYVLPALDEPRVVLRTGSQTLVTVGGVRAVVSPDGSVELGADTFFGTIVDVVQLADGAFAFRDSAGTIASSAGFLAGLARTDRTRVGPALVVRDAAGETRISYGGPPTALGVPDRTMYVAASSERAALALADGGFLYRSVDGGRAWTLLRAGPDVGAPFVDRLAHVRVPLRGQVLELTPDGQLVPADDERVLEELDPRARLAVEAAVGRMYPARDRVEPGPPAGVVLEEGAVFDAAPFPSPCPAVDPSWLTSGLVPRHAVVPHLTVDGALRPLCPELRGRMYVTNVFSRGDGDLVVHAVDEARVVHVAIATGGECGPLRPLPQSAVGACFADQDRGVAWGGANASDLWHTDDGARTWVRLALVVEGGAAALPAPAPEAFVATPQACALGRQIMVRWDEVTPPRVLAPASAVEAVSERGRCMRAPRAALFCREESRAAPPPRGADLEVRCRARRCTVRAGSRAFELGTGPCAPGSRPLLAVEAVTPHGVLVSCPTRGVVRCPCDAPGYWLHDGGTTSLAAEVDEAQEVLVLDDGSLAVRRTNGFHREELVHVDGANGQLRARRELTWRDDWPRGLTVRGGEPHLAVISPNGRAVDLFAVADSGLAVERSVVAYTTVRRACGEDDRGRLRLHTEQWIAAVVWEGESVRETAARFVLGVGTEDTCLDAATLFTGEGRIDIRPRTRLELAGSLGSATISCTLYAAGVGGSSIAR